MTVAGIDTHKDTHSLCVLGADGEVAFEGTFPANEEGYGLIADAIGSFGECRGVGIEGTSSYGAGVCRHLVARGYRVHEVLGPKRARRRRGAAKSDPIDARRAARSVLLGDGLCDPKPHVEWIEQVRVLQAAREQAVKVQTAMVNAARGLLASGPDELRERLDRKSPKAFMEALLRARCARGPVQESTLESLKGLARVWREASERAKGLRARIKAVMEAHAAPLMGMRGSSELAAAKLVVAAGDCGERIGSEARFAAHCGVAPVEASSGRTVRHRLSRGGDRQANRALFSIALVRMRHDERTREYVARRTAEGLSKKEIMRCLKRYIAREAYRLLRQCS